MSTQNTKNKLDPQAETGEDRERLRDIIVVIVTYPLTPTEKTSKLAAKKPWLELVSLVLKILLAVYAIWEAVGRAE